MFGVGLIGHISVLSWSSLCLLLLWLRNRYRHYLVKAQSLTLLGAGEEVAWSLGVNIKRTRTYTLLAISLSVGTVVFFLRLSGFIGLLVPHFIRPRIPEIVRVIRTQYDLWSLGSFSLVICSPLSLPIHSRWCPHCVIGGLVFTTLKPTSVN